MSNVSGDPALRIFDDTVVQQRFEKDQFARFKKHEDAAPSQTGGAAAAATTLGERSVSKFQDQFQAHIRTTQSLIQNLGMDPKKALLFMIGERIGEGHDDAQAVYFAYQVLSTLGLFTKLEKQELLDQVKAEYLNYNAVDEAIAAAGSTLERELDAVETLYDGCAPFDWEKKFPEGYTKERVWNSLFGPLKTEDGQLNPACVEGVLYYYGCLPSEIPEERREFMTQPYAKACKLVDNVAADKTLIAIPIGYDNLIIAPPHLDQCSHVTSFGASKSLLTSLPKNVHALTNLESFCFLDSGFSALPDLSRFPKLKLVDVTQNQLTSLPDLRQNINLTDLTASENSLTGKLQLPTSLLDLTLCVNTQLNFSDFRTLTALKTLNLEDTGLQDFPQLPEKNALQKLLLRGNAISALPASLAHLSGLKKLDFADNQLTDVSEIKSLTALKRLNVSGNQLTDVNAITSLTALEALNIAGTGLTKLPDLSDLKKLKKVTIGEDHKLDPDTMEKLADLRHSQGLKIISDMGKEILL